MQKRAVFLLTFFLLAPQIFWPQQNSSGQEIPQEPSESQAVSQDQESPGDGESKESLFQKAKGLVKEFNEEKEAEQEEGPVNAVQFLGDFLTDRLPLTLDLGAEPGEDGSLVFGSLQYDWKDHFASRVRLEYKSAMLTTDMANGYEKSRSKNYAITIYPALWYFGDTSADSQEALWALGIGAYYAFCDAKNFSCYARDGGLAYVDIGMKYHVLSPVLLASVKKPLGRFFGVGAQLIVRPVYGIFLNMDVASNLAESPFSYYTNSYSSPSFSQSVWLDALKYIRIKGSLEFSRIELESVRYGSHDKRFFLYDTDNNELSLRGGVEIVLPSTNKNRKKDSHLWAGVYYQHTWSVQEALGQSSSSDKGKWVVCFGK